MNKMFHALRTIALCAAALGTAVAAQAGTINFTGMSGSYGAPLVLPEATLTNLTGSTLYIGTGCAGQADGFCFIGSGAAADGRIDFTSTVYNLSFDADGWQQGDFVVVTAFNGSTSLGSLNVTGNMALDFSGFGAITRLAFDDSSTAAGVGYSTFSFDTTGGQLPEPGVLSLAGLALLGAGAARRRKGA